MSDPLGELFDLFLKERIYLHNVTAKTEVWYRSAWKAFQGSRVATGEAETLSRTHLQGFVVWLRQRNVTPRTVNTYLQALNAFGRWLHVEGHAKEPARLPLLRTEKKLIATLSEVEIRQLLRFKPNGFAQWRVHALVCVLLDTGIRIDEALGLETVRVDLDNLLATVFGKGRRERRVPFSLELRKVLFRYQRFRERKGLAFPLLFPTLRGTKWNQRNALRSYYLLLRRLGMPKSGFHRLRHSFATQYLRAGGDVVRLSKVLGHSQITTTMRYAHLLTEDLQAVHQKLSVLNRIR